MNLWPHQIRGTADTLALIAAGCRRICLTCPTGGGKTVMMCSLAKHYLAQGRGVVIYTHRKLLLEQLTQVLNSAGLEHGVRAAGWQRDWHQLLQVASTQTENQRVLRVFGSLHKADLVMFDEAHLHTGRVAQKIMSEHLKAGAAVVGLTATPVGIGHLYDRLVVAGTNTELRKCGALAVARHYGPDEPDLRHIGKVRVGEDLTTQQNVKAIMRYGVFGRILTSYRLLNPDQRPTILFAPGVGESLWLAEQFCENGIRAAHIDGDAVWVDGTLVRSSRAARAEVLEGSQAGHIKVICNRFVMREGIDMPWAGHGIFATVFGSVQSYLQSGGRLLRAYPGVKEVTIQDHGGNWHRHGSLNGDRIWDLAHDGTTISGIRAERLRSRRCRQCREQLEAGKRICTNCGCLNEIEPFRCPQCSEILTSVRCRCGFEINPVQRSRMVVQVNGMLKEHYGDIFVPRRREEKSDTKRLWERCYYGAKNSGRTFVQAEAWFFQKHGYWPPENLPLMPREPADRWRKVADVPREDLYR
jgi:DNA repair protein RadD